MSYNSPVPVPEFNVDVRLLDFTSRFDGDWRKCKIPLSTTVGSVIPKLELGNISVILSGDTDADNLLGTADKGLSGLGSLLCNGIGCPTGEQAFSSTVVLNSDWVSLFGIVGDL